VRLRVPGGQLPARALLDLVEVAETHGDGRVHLTARANLQLRGLPLDDEGRVPEAVVSAIEATGLLPSRSHELVRNVMASPQSGLAGGRADLRPTVRALDRLICADPALATLPGRFLFVLDDGRGDVVDRPLDLGVVAVSGSAAQVRIGTRSWGSVLSLDEAVSTLVELARRFAQQRGAGDAAAWHVDELDQPLTRTEPRHAATHVQQEPLAYGVVPGGDHVPAPDGLIGRRLAEALARASEVLVITPWRGVLVPGRAS